MVRTHFGLLMLISFLLFGGATAFAEPIAGLGASLLYENGADGRSIETRSPLSLSGGYRFPMADVYLEYSMFRASDGESMVSVTRDHHQFLLWARHFFREDWQVHPYVGLGAGLQVQQVETSFAQERSRETGNPDSAVAFSGGIRLPISRYFEVLAEGKLSFAASYSPNPAWGLGAAAGFRF